MQTGAISLLEPIGPSIGPNERARTGSRSTRPSAAFSSLESEYERNRVTLPLEEHVPDREEGYAGRDTVVVRRSHQGSSRVEGTEPDARSEDADRPLQGGRSVPEPPAV